MGRNFGTFGARFGQGNFSNFGAKFGQGLASILAILGLDLGKALGLNFCNFGAKFGQRSGPQFLPFWG